MDAPLKVKSLSFSDGCSSWHMIVVLLTEWSVMGY